LLPRDILEIHLNEKRKSQGTNLKMSVSFRLFFGEPKNRQGQCLEEEGPCLRWNHTRWKGRIVSALYLVM
jgi:hypothetical protein